MKYTKEYINKMRAASHLLAPPASDVVNENLDEISRLQEINEMERRLSDEFYLLLVDDPNTKLKADQIMVNIFGKCEPSPSEVSTTQDVLMDIKKDEL